MEDAPAETKRNRQALLAAVYRTCPRRRAALAALLTLLIHFSAYEFAPETLAVLSRTVVPAKPVELARAEELEKIPEELLPEEFRKKPQFVPVNPNAPVATPSDTTNFSAANQRAAQETPDPDSRDRTPTNDGELEDSAAVSDDALPPELLPPELRVPAPAEPRRASSEAETGTGDSGKKQGADVPALSAGTLAQGDEAAENGNGEEAVVPEPAPRPTVLPPPGLKSITMRSNTSVNEIGVCSLDAKYSEFGDYTQRMLEAIQAAWYIAVRRSSIVQPPAVVVVEFTLHSDGTVDGARIVSSGASAAATYACLDAVESRAPFAPWRADMVALVGKDSEVSRISFYYR